MQTLNELLADHQSVILGTQHPNGYPFSSYAPFYYDGEVIYIFISDIATHAQNIQSTHKASTLFIEDESKSANIFARRRISLQCDARSICRDEERFKNVMERFQEKFDASLVSMLMGMKDFNLYALTPVYGEATFGFGEAYNIGGEKMNQLVTRSTNQEHK